MPRESLLWWEKFCECKVNIGAMQAMTLDLFKALVKKKFYLVNYSNGQQQEWQCPSKKSNQSVDGYI
jgi:hypothetical protein